MGYEMSYKQPERSKQCLRVPTATEESRCLCLCLNGEGRELFLENTLSTRLSCTLCLDSRESVLFPFVHRQTILAQSDPVI